MFNKKGQMTNAEAMLILVLYLVGLAIFLIMKLWPVILIGIVVLILIAISYNNKIEEAEAARKQAEERERLRIKEEKEEEMKRQDLLWIKQPEPVFVSRRMPKVTKSSREAVRISNEYGKYLETKDNVERLQQHIKWIDKYNSICNRYMVTDTVDYSEDRNRSVESLNEEKRKLTGMRYESLFLPNNRISLLKTRYDMLSNAFSEIDSGQYDNNQDVYGFFGTDNTIENNNILHKSFYHFTPWYIVTIVDEYRPSISLFKYSDASIEIWYEEEPVLFATYKDDIARMEWEHARKDGGPDLRYTDNGSTTYVYRGRVKISCGADSEQAVTLRFSNKRDAQKFHTVWNEYVKTIKQKTYSPMVTAVLNHTAKSVDDYYKKKERDKADREKRKQKKDEYIDSLAPGMVMMHKTLGKGKLIRIENGHMIIDFDGNIKQFKYPDAIKQGYFVNHIE